MVHAQIQKRIDHWTLDGRSGWLVIWSSARTVQSRILMIPSTRRVAHDWGPPWTAIDLGSALACLLYPSCTLVPSYRVIQNPLVDSKNIIFQSDSGREYHFFASSWIKKLFVHQKKISRFSCQDTRNDVKRPEKLFGKMSGCVCVCVRARALIHVKSAENSSFCISGITQPIELKFGVHLKQTRSFIDIVFFKVKWRKTRKRVWNPHTPRSH